jgi:hypothetical protein
VSEKTRLSIKLSAPATEMAQEEIGKQVAFLASGITGIRFTDPQTLELDVDGELAEKVASEAKALAQRVQRTLRSLQRQIAFRSSAMDAPRFRGDGRAAGIGFEMEGLSVLEGMPLALFEYFDRCFTEFGHPWKPRNMRVPTLIPTPVLARCDYFRSFPHNVTFASHLPEEPARIEDFRARHQARETLDERAAGDLVPPEACLSPAVCYHVYAARRNTVIPGPPVVASLVGKCFRYESSNMQDLRRLWDFTMRELVFLGTRDDVLAERTKGIEAFKSFMEEHQLAGEIRTASDPFFVAPDSTAKTYFQISSETKFEISLLLPDDGRVAVGSFNHHGDFFGKAFDIKVAGDAPMHSVCFAWGLERWVYAFLAQHGNDPAHWPAVMRRAPELAELA